MQNKNCNNAEICKNDGIYIVWFWNKKQNLNLKKL